MDPLTALQSLDRDDTINLLGLNDSQIDTFDQFVQRQQSAVNDAEQRMFFSNLTPFLLESFAFGSSPLFSSWKAMQTDCCVGIVSIAALLLAYTHLRQKSSPRYIISLALSVGVLALHWALAYRAIVLYSPVTSIVNEAGTLCETVVFGALTSLALLALILFFKSRDTSARSHWTLSRCFPFGVIVVMYVAAAVHWGLGTRNNLQANPEDVFSAVYIQSLVGSSVTLSLNIVCSDAVVLWRACTVWMNRRWIVLLSAFLIFATAASSIANVTLKIKTVLPFYTEGYNAPGLGVDSLNASTPLLTTPGLISLGISIFTNIFATLAIAYKAWRHRALVRKHLTTGSRRLITEKIMCIFIESGAVYICLWALYVFATIVPYMTEYTSNFALGDAINNALEPYSYSMIQITAIYPTLIIILVFLEKKAHFARDPSIITRLPAAHVTIATMIHSTPTEVLDIRPEEIDAERSRQEDTVDWRSDDSSLEVEYDGKGSI